ncbi:MAG: hypothetical protein ACHQ1D_08455 [Nitrososphaerales archaeon]
MFTKSSFFGALIALCIVAIFACDSSDSQLTGLKSNSFRLAENESFIALQEAKLEVKYAIFTSSVEEYSSIKNKVLRDFEKKSWEYIQNIYSSNPWLEDSSIEERAVAFTEAEESYQKAHLPQIPIAPRASCLTTWIDCERAAFDAWDLHTSQCQYEYSSYGECLNEATNNYMFLSQACEDIYDACED